MFYLSRIMLEGFKCFPERVDIEFTRPSPDHSAWTVVLGANGTGKTSILRAIAMCLCDETAATGLLTELSGSMVRNGCDKAEIELELASDDEPPITHKITTTIHGSQRGSEELAQPTKLPENFPYDRLFACGYGAARSTIGSESVRRYEPLDAFYSLFNYEARLQNPELALLRIAQHTKTDVEQVIAPIVDILQLPSGSVAFERDGLRVTGPWGTYVPAGAMGDGYAATLAWICDLLGWAFLAGRSAFDGTVRGIVLLDELEQHLHPSWQREIVRMLAQQFPNVQFIATTHSPLVAIGLASLPDRCGQLIALNYNNSLDGVEVRAGLPAPRAQRADQVLTSHLFGLPWTASDDVIRNVERYAYLCEPDSLSNAEQREKERLQQALIPTLRSPEHLLPEEGQVLPAIVEQMLQETADLWQSHFPGSPLRPETLRDLQGLFERAGGVDI